MGKKKSGDVDGDAKPDKGKPYGKPSAQKKVRIEIFHDNWIKLNAYIKSYNKDSRRMTPKTDVERVIHEALAAHLASGAKG